jgi:hypothetical protein
MSQKCVELLLGRILTDEDFRRDFFPIRDFSFAVAAAHGLELSPVERNALSTLKSSRFEFIATTLDPRILRAGISVFRGDGCRPSGTAGKGSPS